MQRWGGGERLKHSVLDCTVDEMECSWESGPLLPIQEAVNCNSLLNIISNHLFIGLKMQEPCSWRKHSRPNETKAIKAGGYDACKSCVSRLKQQGRFCHERRLNAGFHLYFILSTEGEMSPSVNDPVTLRPWRWRCLNRNKVNIFQGMWRDTWWNQYLLCVCVCVYYMSVTHSTEIFFQMKGWQMRLMMSHSKALTHQHCYFRWKEDFSVRTCRRQTAPSSHSQTRSGPIPWIEKALFGQCKALQQAAWLQCLGFNAFTQQGGAKFCLLLLLTRAVRVLGRYF